MPVMDLDGGDAGVFLGGFVFKVNDFCSHI